MIIIAVDLGLSRTGLAVCDKMELLAVPLKIIKEKNQEKLAELICNEIKSTNAQILVLGLPKNMDGSEGKSAKHTHYFAKLIRSISDIDIILWDERQTTMSATNYLNITDTRGEKRKSVIDAASAMIILQSYLDYRANKNREHS